MILSGMTLSIPLKTSSRALDMYGFDDFEHGLLASAAERISENRVARLASSRRLATSADLAAMVASQRWSENGLEQQFQASAPDQVRVADITCIKPHEGWL